MPKQFIQIEPELTTGIDITGADFWREDWPDANKFNLKYQRLVSDDRKSNPKDGFNQEIWLLEGSKEDINSFIASSPKIVKLTPADAKKLADIIRPGKTVTRDCFGTPVEVTIPPWVPSPL